MKSRDNVARIPTRKMRKMMAKLAMPQAENFGLLVSSSVGVRLSEDRDLSLSSLLPVELMRRVATRPGGTRRIGRLRGVQRE